MITLALAALILRNQNHQYRQKAAAERESAPQDALPVRRHLRCVDGHGGRHSIFAPHDDGLVIKFIHAAPAGECQQWIIIRIPYENPFQAVMVRVSQYCPQRVKARLAEVF